MTMDGVAFEKLHEEDPAGAFDYSQNSGMKDKVLGYVKAAGAAAWGQAFSLAGIPVIGSLPALVSGTKSMRHASGLAKLKTSPVNLCNCGMCEQMIDYAIIQKHHKAAKKLGSAVPVVGTLISAGSKLRYIYKWKNDTQGKARQFAAVTIWHAAREGCPKGKAILEELLGAGAVERAKQAANGYEFVFKKLASG
jgi:hypothetical protein